MPDPTRLNTLRTLREEARISQEIAATYCGLSGRQGRLSLGAWENGESTPQRKRRARFIPYLWDHLHLRSDPQKFLRTWEILVEEWDWEPISDGEWQRLTSAPRPVTTVPPPLQSLPASPAPFQAPALTPHFVGRETEFTQIETLLTAATGPRIVALVGMGGIGKTTLAVGLAHRLRARFKDGVLWGHAATSDPLDILQSWALAFGYDYSGLSDVQSRTSAVRALLHQKQVLIVLDDAIKESETEFLLPNGSNCFVLVTTRSADTAQALNAIPIELHTFTERESLLLLEVLLGDRVHQELMASRQLCELLDHLPLAVEIVSKQLRARSRLGIDEMVAELTSATSRLDLAISNRPLRASFAISWQALNGTLQRIFSHMAVFEGRSFTVEALASVLKLDLSTTRRRVEDLKSLSLVSEAEGNRYRQHPLLADFAREMLGEDGEAWLEMVRYYHEFAKDSQIQKEQFDAEWGNLMAAMRTVFAFKQWTDVLKFAEMLSNAWFAQGRFREARLGYQWAVTSATALADQKSLAINFIRWGHACSEQADWGEAEVLLENGKAICLTIDGQQYLADAYYYLARIALERGDYEHVDEMLTACHEIRNNLGDTPGAAMVMYLRAFLCYRSSSYEQGVEQCKQAIAIQETHNDLPGKVRTLRILSDCLCEQGNYHGALAVASESVQLAIQLDYKNELAESYFYLAAVYRCLEQLPLAWEHAEKARVLLEHIGNRSLLAFTLYEESVIQMKLGDLQGAFTLGVSSLSQMKEINEIFNRVSCLFQLVRISLKLNRTVDAALYLDEAIELAHSLRHPLLSELQKLQLLIDQAG